MPFAALTFPADPWRWPIAGVLLLAVAAVVWSYRRAPAAPWRSTCAALKILAFVLAALCLLEPQWTSPRARPGANLFVVAADNSGSLAISDAGAGAARSEEMRASLNPATALWQALLADSFDVRRYLFDTAPRGVDDFSGLSFDGRASAIGASLRGISARYTNRPLAGLILLTDGNATDMTTLPEDLRSLPPVYPVVIGGAGPERDLAVARISATQTAFEDAPVTVDATVTTSGYAGQNITAKLIASDGKPGGEQTVAAQPENRFRFQIKPEGGGTRFYRFSIAPEKPGGPPDASEANNSAVIAINRGEGPYRILYVSGRPNWEYKFLNRALGEDPQLRLTALMRVAKREPKFDFLGRAGEKSNPLFRGFGDQERETAGSYDQPVLVRLNTRDGEDLRAGFPRVPEELFGYHAVILDDVESAFFTAEQAALVRKFVSARGGGLLMLGGMESFREGGYARTPIGEALPVTLDGAPDTAPWEGVKFDLDRDGWLQPWARLRDNESAEKARLAEMPEFRVLNRVRGVKPGAAVIATASGRAGAAPALVVQRFGRGRSAALLAGDIWRWGMRSPEARTDMEKAWRQLARWLTSDTPERVSLAAEPAPADSNGAMRLEVRVADAKFEPVENAAVSVEVEPVIFPGEPAAEGKITLRAEPSPDEPGLYVTAHVPRRPGGYLATAKAVNEAGAEEGRASAGWASDPAALEFRSLVPNRALMEELAAKTGGAVTEVKDLDALVRSLPQRKAPVMEADSQPLWHTPWIFLTAVACLVSEWGLRRAKGLP